MFIDVNCSIGTWPTRPLPITDATELAKHLRAELVDVALVSSIEAALLEDPTDSNLRLADSVSNLDGIIPIPVVNPRHRRWERELANIIRNTNAPAIKVHLNYHNSGVDTPEFEALAQAAVDLGLSMLVPLRIEDERLSNVRLQAPPVSLADLATFAEAKTGLNVIALNAYRNEALSVPFPKNLYVDLAFCEYFRTVETLAQRPGLDKVVFGSNTPFFVTRAASMKLVWANIPDETRQSIAGRTASLLFGIDVTRKPND